METTSETEKRLNKIQNYFVRLVLRLGPGSPLVAILWDSSLLDMKLRIWEQKVMMVFHIRSLDKDTLANTIYEEQKSNEWPGLYQETKQICEDLQIEDCNITRLSKQTYKEVVLAACHKKNEETLRSKANEGKCSRISGEEYGMRDYLKTQNISET